VRNTTHDKERSFYLAHHKLQARKLKALKWTSSSSDESESHKRAYLRTRKNEFRTKTSLLKIIIHPKDYYKGRKRKPESQKGLLPPNFLPFFCLIYWLPIVSRLTISSTNLTLFSKFFSSFPHGTCSLSVSRLNI